MVTATTMSNPDFVVWMRLDQFLISWLLSSISEKMLGHVIHGQYSAEQWNVLERLFFTKPKARILQLRLSLETIKMGSSSIEDYVLKMKTAANDPMATGQHILGDKLVLYILSGLGPKFESVVNLTSKYSDSLQEVQYMLQTHELRLANLNVIYG